MGRLMQYIYLINCSNSLPGYWTTPIIYRYELIGEKGRDYALISYGREILVKKNGKGVCKSAAEAREFCMNLWKNHKLFIDKQTEKLEEFVKNPIPVIPIPSDKQNIILD